MALERSSAIAQRPLSGLRRRPDIEPDDSVQGVKLTVVHIGRRMPEVAETRGFEPRDGLIE